MSDPVVAAEEWIAGDPDPVTRAELAALIESANAAELAERMAGTLEFGTAGIRGKVEAGSNRMNRAVVIRTTAGLADHLNGRGSGLVVIGRDARLSSEAFMTDTIAVLAAAGIPVRYAPDPTPTPVIAYAALHLEATAAVVITASHNPPQDNGYKVYDANGAQIIAPVDAAIASAIAAVGPASGVPRLDDPYHHHLVAPVAPDIFSSYLSDLGAARTVAPEPGDLGITYTPMHGVGGRFVVEALAHFGYRNVAPVPEQYDPDGRFPTVAFPNPEEQGALDLATAQAERDGSDLIIANDPDTDRLAVSVPRPGEGWRPLTGNQVGVLLADFILTHGTVPDPIVINSIVSSPMLAAVAEHHGAGFAQTLTGFKWIWNAALELEAAGEGHFVFGYEEALGYSVSRQVRDKDGISAAVVFADLAADARAAGSTVLGRLEDLYRRHGVWVSTQENVVRPGTEGATEIAHAMLQLAEYPPTEVGGYRVVAATDYMVGAGLRPSYLGATPLLALDLGDAGRVLIRPSGTEPKLKVYVDLVAPAGDDQPSVVERSLLDRAGTLGRAVVDLLGL